MVDLMLLIGGRTMPASNGVTFERLNPITGQVATTAAAATLDDAHAAVVAAAAAFPAWSALAPTERRKRLSKAADLLDSRTGEFIAAMAEETGSTAAWAGFNVYLAANMLREAAAMCTQISGEVIPSDKPA